MVIDGTAWLWVESTYRILPGPLAIQNCGHNHIMLKYAYHLDDEKTQCLYNYLGFLYQPADVIYGLIVHHEGTVRVLQGGMGGQDGIVWLYHSSGYLGCWINSKFKLGLLAIVNRQPFHQERSEPGSSPSTKGMEQQKSLQTRALITQLADLIQNKINDFLANSVVTSGIVVGSIFFATYQLFWMEQLAVLTTADFI